MTKIMITAIKARIIPAPIAVAADHCQLFPAILVIAHTAIIGVMKNLVPSYQDQVTME